MKIGCLGDIPFQVSDAEVQTFTSFKWSGSVQISTHKRHLTDALTEVTGRDPDKIEFKMTLSAFLGVNPETAINKIWEYERGFVALPLVIGDKGYGKYRWLINSHSITGKQFDGSGNMLSCEVSIKLVEYIKGAK